MLSKEFTLPPGLCFHCDECRIVIPSDAPRIDGGDCMFVARHKLTWFNPAGSPAGQHHQAAAAWALIYDDAMRSIPWRA